MSRRTEELHALRGLRDIILAAPAESVTETVRDVASRCASLGPRSYGPKSELAPMGGGGGCVDFDLALPRTPPEEQILKTSQNPELAPIESAPIGRPTWLSVFGAAWRDKLGGSPPWGQLARALKPVVAEHGEAETLRRWKNYLIGAGAQYVSPARFASTFGAWTTPDPDKWKHDPSEFRPGESHESYIHRQVRGHGR